jgi:tRNA 2-selenouridine synthase
MAIEKLNIEDFLSLSKSHPVVDVRSPGEYLHAHIPGAHNLPLFSNEERKIVGTLYKQQSRETAIKTGLDIFGQKMSKMVEEVESFAGKGKIILIHCWRGGMRSAGVAWLMDLYGYRVYTLNGGYKKFRHYVLETFTQPLHFKILGGFTGSGKTKVLKELKKQDESIIDLEDIAQHKGSAFGALEGISQPSQEMFENRLAIEFRKLRTGNTWIEDETQRIGLLNIPQEIWKKMRVSPLYFLEIPFEERLTHITEEYGNGDKEKIANGILRIQKRLGGLETKNAILFLQDDNIKECFRVLLRYYDKCYLNGLDNRYCNKEQVQKLAFEKIDVFANTRILMNLNALINEPIK